MSSPTRVHDKVIHIVEKSMSIDQLIMIMYNSPNQLVYDHFKMVNAHLKNDKVQVGQIVLLSPANSNQCTQEEADFLEIAHAVDKTLLMLDSSERKILAKRYDFLSNVASYNGLLLGVSNTTWNAHTNQVKAILKDLERSYVSSYNSTGNLNSQGFFAKRKVHFQRLNTALNRFGQPTLGRHIVAGDIRSNLGLSSKSIVHQWRKQPGNATTIPNFARNYKTVAKMARHLKRVGYVGIALTGVDAVSNIQKACSLANEATCTKAKYKNTMKAAGSIAGGATGGAISIWATCSLVFGLPSGGTSFFWCSVVAGAAGGYASGKIAGNKAESFGEELYKWNGIK
ncbi:MULTISPECIES: hypothetical protein [unclassified Agarivorans]|uniref:hypothetical protein n=1 Tax=unclassified Agarivorans TaxID=2636026 RepID=UPI003D7E54CA